MTKHGKVEVGKTPSVVSGRPATKIEDDEPVRKGEQPADAGLKKLASILDETKPA
jgi:hypothetical protein